MSRYRQDWNFGTPTGRGTRDREQAARHRLHQEGLSGTASRPMNSFDAALDALREILAARASGPAVLTFNAGGAQLIFSHLPSAT